MIIYSNSNRSPARRPADMDGNAAAPRKPAHGELVEILGIRRRPELNGLTGKVIHEEPDKEGCVVVRLKDGDGTDVRQMKIHICRLRPVGGFSREASALSAAAPQRSSLSASMPQAPSQASRAEPFEAAAGAQEAPDQTALFKGQAQAKSAHTMTYTYVCMYVCIYIYIYIYIYYVEPSQFMPSPTPSPFVLLPLAVSL